MSAALDALDALRALADALAATEREESEAVEYVAPSGLWADVEPAVRRIIDLLTPPTVTTAAELDALPMGAVVVDAVGDPWMKDVTRWMSPETQHQPAVRMVRYAPFTVVWTP